MLSINRMCGATASRVGIATGMIIVSSPPVDGGGAQKLELVGDPPGTAARLQVLASSGTVLIDQSTRQLIGDLFDCRDIGVIDASGTARAWEVLGPGTAESRFAAIGPAKQIAQVCAAIGREFSYELLFAVVGGTDADLQSALERLTDTGLVFRRGSPPRSTYLFKHALIQDTAYSTLLRRRRQELHAQACSSLSVKIQRASHMIMMMLAGV